MQAHGLRAGARERGAGAFGGLGRGARGIGIIVVVDVGAGLFEAKGGERLRRGAVPGVGGVGRGEQFVGARKQGVRIGIAAERGRLPAAGDFGEAHEAAPGLGQDILRGVVHGGERFEIGERRSGKRLARLGGAGNLAQRVEHVEQQRLGNRAGLLEAGLCFELGALRLGVGETDCDQPADEKQQRGGGGKNRDAVAGDELAQPVELAAGNGCDRLAGAQRGQVCSERIGAGVAHALVGVGGPGDNGGKLSVGGRHQLVGCEHQALQQARPAM